MSIQQDILNREKEEYLSFDSGDTVLYKMSQAVKDIEKLQLEDLKHCILLCGPMICFDTKFAKFANHWYEKENKLVVFSEGAGQYARHASIAFKMPIIQTPLIMSSGIAVRKMKIQGGNVFREYCKKHNLIAEASSLNYIFANDLGDNYPEAWTCYVYKYLNVLLDKIRPKEVVMWNEFIPMHKILYKVCRSRGIPFRFIEYGAIPGTYCIEKNGQIGESDLSRLSTRYTKKLLGNNYDDVESLLNYLYETGLNRYKQEDYDWQLLLKNYDKNRKTVIFWGQNDEESGIQPYTKNSKRSHSRFFDTSLSAAVYVRTICIRNNWNFIYKPHPSWVKRWGVPEIDADVITRGNCNRIVDFADVNITISSQISYISLIREKPIVMLGKNTLSKKKIAYESSLKIGIEHQIRQAIKYGLTKLQKKNFEYHCAYLLQKCLFDDLTHEDFKYGKAV